VDGYSAPARALLESFRSAFDARGADMATATDRARAAVFGLVARQATMVSFTEVFRLLGLLFLAMMPLILIMRGSRAGKHGEPLAH
jgi:DHA2 family multidrug resistance protein